VPDLISFVKISGYCDISDIYDAVLVRIEILPDCSLCLEPSMRPALIKDRLAYRTDKRIRSGKMLQNGKCCLFREIIFPRPIVLQNRRHTAVHIIMVFCVLIFKKWLIFSNSFEKEHFIYRDFEQP